MQNRFNLKDLVLLASMAGVGLLVVLCMYMIDRQWLRMAQMEKLISEQSSDLRHLRQGITDLRDRGLALPSQSATQQASVSSDAFSDARKVLSREDYAEGDWLMRSFSSSLKTITPLVSSDAYASEVQGYVLESLLQRNPDTLEWQGRVAESWTVSEDGLVFRFNIKPGVTFSDGAPLSASDVAFTFSFLMDERIAAPRQRAYFEKIERVTAVSERVVEFRFVEPYFDSLALAGGMEILAEHFYKPYLDDPEKFNQSKGVLLGSGPYRLIDPKGWTPDSGMVELERNSRYWGTAQPSFNKIIWKVIENETANLTAFRNGETDVYSAKPREYKKLNADQGLMARAESREYTSPGTGYSFIAWNQQREAAPTRFADKRVRQAMTLLTDRVSIAADIMLGYAEPAAGPFSPQSAQHSPDVVARAFSLDAAVSLLREAGYADRNGDGVLDDEKGVPFQFELTYFQDNEDTRQIVLFLKDLYARAGIRLEPKPTEWSVMLDAINKKSFDAITLGWTGSVESDLYQIFHSSQIGPGADNFISYANPELDRLIEAARSNVDESERMPLWQAAEKVLYEDQPYTFLLRRKSLVFIDKRFRNVEVKKAGLNISESPGGWYVPLALQKYH